MVEANRGYKKRGGKTLAGLALLRHECQRFREEVVCIRSFPRMQRRWPSLARLEIGIESSEEDDTVWDSAEAPKCDPLLVSDKSEGGAIACGDATELHSQESPGVSVDRAKGGSSDERRKIVAGDRDKSLEHVKTSQDSQNQGYKDVDIAVLSLARVDIDEREFQGPPNKTSEHLIGEQSLVPVTVVEGRSNPSPYASSMDLEGKQDSPSDQTLTNVHVNPGARTAATAFFTANPHFRSLELSTQCSPYNNLTYQREGFKVVGVPRSSVSYSASCKESEVLCGQFICSSLDCHKCSTSQLGGCATMSLRNQISLPVETDSLEEKGAVCDKSFSNSPDPVNHLPIPLAREASYCSSDTGLVEMQSSLELKELDRASVKSSWVRNGHCKTLLLGPEQEKNCHLLTTNSVQEAKLPFSTKVAYSSRAAAQFSGSVHGQHENGLSEEMKEEHEVLLTDNYVEGERLPTQFLSQLGATSNRTTSSFGHQRLNSVSTPSEHVNQRVSGLSGLIALSGGDALVRLGMHSSRDSAMAARMATRIKYALEMLGDKTIGENGSMKSSRFHLSGMERCIFPVGGRKGDVYYGGDQCQEAQTFQGTELKRSMMPGGLVCENSSNRGFEHHFDPGNHCQSLHSPGKCRFYAQSEIPEEPDVYLQRVIGALDLERESGIEEPSLGTPNYTTGVAVNEDSSILQDDASMGRQLSQVHESGTSLPSTGELSECSVCKRGLTASRISDRTTVVKEESSFEELRHGNDGDLVKSENIGCLKNQGSVVEHSSVDKAAFSVEISAPAGASVDIEVGGHPPVWNCQQELRHRDAGKSSVNKPSTLFHHGRPPHSNFDVPRSATSYYQGRPSMLAMSEKCNISQQRNLHVSPCCHSDGCLGHSPVSVLESASLEASNVGGTQHTEHAPLGTSTLLARKVSVVDILPPKPRKTVRFASQEDVLNSFDRKIESLVKKANQLEKEKLPWDTSRKVLPTMMPHQGRMEVTEGEKRQLPTLQPQVSEVFNHTKDCDQIHEGTQHIGRARDNENAEAPLANDIKVRNAQRPLCLKPPRKTPTLDAGFLNCSSPPESPTIQTAKSLQEFSAAAAALACELKLLMRKRSPERHMESPGRTQWKGGTSYAQAIGAQAVGSVATEPTMQPSYTKHSKPSKYAKLDDVRPSALLNGVWKNREQQKRRSALPPRSPKVLPSQHYSGSKDKADDGMFGKKHGRAICQKAHHSSSVDETLASTWKIDGDMAGHTAEYDVIRQELRDLHLERKKLEWLGNTILSTVAAPLEQECRTLAISRPEGKKEHEPSNEFPKPRIGYATRDSKLVSGYKRSRSVTFPHKESGKKLIRSDSGCMSFPARQLSNVGHRHVPSAAMDNENGVGNTRVLKSCCLAAVHSLQGEKNCDGQISGCHAIKDSSSSRKVKHESISTVDASQNQKEAHCRMREEIPSLLAKGVKSSTSRRSSDVLQRGNCGVRDFIKQRSLPPDTLVVGKTVDLFDGTLGANSTLKNEPTVETKDLKVGSALYQSQAMVVPPLTSSLVVGDVNGSDSQVRNYAEGNETAQAVAPFTVELNKYRIDKLSSPLTERVLDGQTLKLNGKLLIVDEATQTEETLNVLTGQYGQDYSEKYLLQAFDSSSPSSHPVNCLDEFTDTVPLDKQEASMQPQAQIVAPTAQCLQDEKCQRVKASSKLAEVKTPTKKSDSVLSNGQVGQDGALCLQRYGQKLYSDGRPPLEYSDRREVGDAGNHKIASSRTGQKFQASNFMTSCGLENEASWSGSLESVLAAYKAAQGSAIFLARSSLEARTLKNVKPFPCRYEDSQKFQHMKNNKSNETPVKKAQSEKFIAVLPTSRKNKDIIKRTPRHAVNECLKSKQKSGSGTGLLDRKQKLQGGLVKRNLQKEEPAMCKFHYKTGQLGLHNRPEWNDSTELSEDRHTTCRNTRIKEMAQALIKRVLHNESTGKQTQLRIKRLQPVKALGAGIRRKRKDPVDLEMYASALDKINTKDQQSFTLGSPSRGKQKEVRASSGLVDYPIVEYPTSSSIRRRNTDLANYFTVKKPDLETENHGLDEFAMACRTTVASSQEHTTMSGIHFMDEDVRESIEHWLDTSGGFEYLNEYDKLGGEDNFNRQASTSTNQVGTSCSARAIAGAYCGAHPNRTYSKQLTSAKFQMEMQNTSTAGMEDLQPIKTAPAGDLIDSSCIVDSGMFSIGVGNSNQCSASAGTNRDLSLGLETSEAGLGTSYVNNQHGRGCLHLESGDVESSEYEAQRMYRKIDSSQNASRDQSQRIDIASCGHALSTSSLAYQKAEEVSLHGQVHVDPPDYDITHLARADELPQRIVGEKLTEDEELELALLEIVLHTILKDDPVGASETLETKLSLEVSPRQTASKSRPSGACPSVHKPADFSLVGSLPSRGQCAPPVLSTCQETLIDDKRKLKVPSTDQSVQALVRSRGPASEERTSNSAKSSGGEWPEYKCLADMQSGSGEEDVRWPEYHGMDEHEAVDDLHQGSWLEEVPFEHISALSTSGLESDQRLRLDTLPPPAVEVSTRPPYSAVHSVRAAERQQIDFPGISSLAFGYPSPRPPPPPKRVGQSVPERGSVGIQTTEAAIHQTPVASVLQCPPLSSSVFVVPVYCLSDGRQILPPYSVYPQTFPFPGGSAQPSTEPMVNPAQYDPQSSTSLYAFTERGTSPILEPLSVPPQQFTMAEDVPGTIPVTASVEHDLQVSSGPAIEHVPISVVNSHSVRNPTSGCPSEPSAYLSEPFAHRSSAKLVPKSQRFTSSQLRNFGVGVSELHSGSDLDSCSSSSHSHCSSPTTPSTYVSSPEHDARVASALADGPVIVKGTASNIFTDISSYEAECYRGEDVRRSKQDVEIQVEDQVPLLLPGALLKRRDVEEEELPVRLFLSESLHGQSRVEAHPSNLVDCTTFSMGSQHDSGTSVSVDSPRSTVVVASYDGSGSSEGSVKKMRQRIGRTISLASNLEEGDSFRKGKQPAAQSVLTQTSSWSSGEIRGTFGSLLYGTTGNKASLEIQHAKLSEGEVELGQMPSEGECYGIYPRTPQGWLVDRPKEGQDDGVSEPGEIGGKRQLVSRGRMSGAHYCSSQSLSEGESREATLIEPGEVRARTDSTEKQNQFLWTGVGE